LFGQDKEALMTLRKLVGLAAIGGFFYAHKKRGGQMTLESIKETGRSLIDGVRDRAVDIRSQAESRLHDAANKVADAVPGDKSQGQQDVGYGSGGYGYGGSGFGGGSNIR
jgi:hypothetical protein